MGRVIQMKIKILPILIIVLNNNDDDHFRITNTGRVIQMNMEISLILAHILLLYGGDPEMIVVCKVISFLIHLFHTTCFVFMFLEALYTYSLVAFVVKKDGLLTKVR